MIDEKVNGKQDYVSGKQLEEKFLETSQKADYLQRDNLMDIHKQKVRQRSQERMGDISGLQKIVYEVKEFFGRGEAYQINQQANLVRSEFDAAQTTYENKVQTLEKFKEKLSDVQKEMVDVHEHMRNAKRFYQHLTSRKDTLESELEMITDSSFDTKVHEKTNDLREIKKQALDVYREGISASARFEQLENRAEQYSSRIEVLHHEAVHLADQISHAGVQLDMYEVQKEVSGEFNPHIAHDLYERLGARTKEFSKIMDNETPKSSSFDGRFGGDRGRKLSKTQLVEDWKKLPKPE